MVLLFLLFAVLFVLDALYNWGIFRSKKKYGVETYAERYRKYGPIERTARLALGLTMVLIMLRIAAVFFERGGFDALMNPSEYTGADWRPPPPPNRAPPPVVVPASKPEPDPVPTPPPLKAEDNDDDDMHFWLYVDEKGTKHMVDKLEKIPPQFRASAQEMN